MSSVHQTVWPTAGNGSSNGRRQLFKWSTGVAEASDMSGLSGAPDDRNNKFLSNDSI
jgi:hypothetical protein